MAPVKEAKVVLDTGMAGRRNAMNPVELLLSALAACMLKGIARVTPMLSFQIERAEIPLKATRKDAPPQRERACGQAYDAVGKTKVQRVAMTLRT